MTYVIVMTKEFYGPSKRKSLVLTDGWQRAERFATIASAKAAINVLTSGTYYLSHNESAPATYKVARIDALPAYLSAQI